MSARPVIRQLAQLDDYASLATNHAHTSAQISALDASDTTTGTFATGRIPPVTAAMVAADVATQAELDASALLGLIKAPPDSARNLVTSPGVTVTPLTIKSAAGQDSADASLLEFTDSSDDVWLRFKAPVTDPMPAPDTNVDSTGRIEFPYMGTGRGPVGISSWQTLHTSQPTAGIGIGYNDAGSGARILSSEPAGTWKVERWRPSAGVEELESYFEFGHQSDDTLSGRPIYVNYHFQAANTTRATVYGDLSLIGNPFKVFVPNPSGAANNVLVWNVDNTGATTMVSPAGFNTLLSLQPPAGQGAALLLGFSGTANIIQLNPVDNNQFWLGFGQGTTREIRVFRAGGSSTLRVSIGNAGAAATLGLDVQEAGLVGLNILALTGQSANLIDAKVNAVSQFSVSPAGLVTAASRVDADYFNVNGLATTPLRIQSTNFLSRGGAGTDEITINDNAFWKSFKIKANNLVRFEANATGIGFFAAPPVGQPAAYTQTYATATRTHANPTAVTLTDLTTGTPNTTLAFFAGATYVTDAPTIINNFADLAASNNAIIADLGNLKQLVNALIDDKQAMGLCA